MNSPIEASQNLDGITLNQVAQHMSFSLGSAVKHIWVACGDAVATEDLHLAAYHIFSEIERRGRQEAVEKANAVPAVTAPKRRGRPPKLLAA